MGLSSRPSPGTQHDPTVTRKPNGVPEAPAGTLALLGDLKGMTANWLVGASFRGYGATLTVGVGIPIPILDETICKYTAVRDEEISAKIVDYSDAYPNCIPETLGEANYKQLKSGKITINAKEVPTAPLSSYPRAREIASILKDWIEKGEFFLSEPVASIPGAESGVTFKPLKERPVEEQ